MVGVLAVSAPSVVLAHGTPSRHDRSSVLWTWTWDPLVVGILCLSGLLYGMGVLRRRGTRLAGGWQPLAFLSGWPTIVIALLSPQPPDRTAAREDEAGNPEWIQTNRERASWSRPGPRSYHVMSSPRVVLVDTGG